MIKKLVIGLTLACLPLFTANVFAAQMSVETITPNKLTIVWEDDRQPETTIDTFRIVGYNVAQLRTLVEACGGSVIKSGEAYRVVPGGEKTPFSDIAFSGVTDVRVQYNITKIMDANGSLTAPAQPGWVFLSDYSYNWGSIRDVLSALNLELKSVDDDPKNASTTVVIGNKPGEVGTLAPAGYIDYKPFYVNYAVEIKPYIAATKSVKRYVDRSGDEQIWIYSPTGISEIRIYEVEYEMSGENFTFKAKGEYHKESLMKNEVLELLTTVPEGIPFTALGFTDSAGKLHTYLVGYNGRTGGVNLSPVELE
ncbi:MAG: hypothetical protein LBU32_05185 [Clostridiales bacterium]|jgi:hypothetical protein|nr:hypothetical protein [Clostridiales bacterium]